MAAAQEQKSSTGPILGISGSVLMPIIFSVILFIALAGKANGTSPKQPINPAPGSTENTALNSLLAMSNKDAFMAANSSQITQLIAQATQTQTALKNNDPAYKTISPTDKVTALNLLVDILTKLPQLQQASSNTARVAQSLGDDVKKLDLILPSLGAQLNVPAVTQGGPGGCGRTSMDEIGLYYNHGQIPAGYESAFTGSGTDLTELESTLNEPTEQHMTKITGKSGWKWVSIGNRTADQLFKNIKASIDGKDPVLMYTYGVYYRKNHIVAVSGYDEATRTIIANNSAIPLFGGTKKNAWTSDNHSHPVPITVDFVYKQISATEDFFSGHSFMIQSKYWN